MVSLPRLPIGWQKIQGLFERYWDSVLSAIELAFARLEALPTIQAELAAVQNQTTVIEEDVSDLQTSLATLNTDDITEGSVNLFYTETRSREALEGVGAIEYDSVTGEIGLSVSGVTAGTYLTPTSITVDQYGRITAIS